MKSRAFLKQINLQGLAEVLVEEEDGEWCVAVEQALEVGGVTSESTDDVALRLHELLLEVVGSGGVAVVLGLGVQTQGLRGQLLLRIEGLSQAVQLAKLEYARVFDL